MFRPHRLRRIWRACGAWGRRDPTLFIAAFATWVILNGVSLLATDDTFSHSPIYSVARDIGVPEDATGVVMLLNGFALLWGLGDRPPHVRSAIALATGMFWCIWAFMLGAGGWRNGFFSSGASWTFLMALALMRVSSAFFNSDAATASTQSPSRTEVWDE